MRRKMSIEADLAVLKEKLASYKKEEIIFSHHADEQIALRQGSTDEVVQLIQNPEKLVFAYSEENDRKQTVYCLYFDKSSQRTIKLPVIFDKEGRKSLYILTYILRYRRWQSMIRRQ